MSKFQEELLLLLGGVAIAVGGAVGLFYLDGWNFAKAACACLAPEAEFRQWASDYYDEEGREWSRLP